MGKLSTYLTDDKVLRALLVGSFLVVDSWKLYLIFRNILMLRDMPEAPPELDISPMVYDKMQMLTQYEAERHLLNTIIEFNIKVAKLVFNFFPYVWTLTADYKFNYGNPLVARAMLFTAVDNSVEVAAVIPLVFLSSLLTGVGSPLLIVLDQIIDVAFRGIVSAVGTYGIIYITDRYGAGSILIGNLTVNGLGIVFMAFFYKFLMSFNYVQLPDNETGRAVLGLAKEAGYSVDTIYVDKRAPEPNASYNSAILSNTIIINETLLNLLDAPQATGVIAHELGHWAYCHPHYTYVVQTIEIFAMGYFWILSYGSSKLIRIFQIEPNVHPFIPVYMAFYFIWPSFKQLFEGAFNLFKTQLEFTADDYACRLSSPKNLRQALVTISLKLPMFPLLDGWFTAWFIGHPSILQRIRRIDDKQ